jgi:hypothetical protein
MTSRRVTRSDSSRPVCGASVAPSSRRDRLLVRPRAHRHISSARGSWRIRRTRVDQLFSRRGPSLQPSARFDNLRMGHGGLEPATLGSKVAPAARRPETVRDGCGLTAGFGGVSSRVVSVGLVAPVLPPETGGRRRLLVGLGHRNGGHAKRANPHPGVYYTCRVHPAQLEVTDNVCRQLVTLTVASLLARSSF